MSRSFKPCRLLQLPAELRNQIYEYTLRQNGGIIIVDISETSSATSTRHLLALETTCKQIRSETSGSLFELNNVELRAPLLEVDTKCNFEPECEQVFPEAQDIANRLGKTLQHLRVRLGLCHVKVWLGRFLWEQWMDMDFYGTLCAVGPGLRTLRDEGVKMRVSFVYSPVRRQAVVFDFSLESEETAMADLAHLANNEAKQSVRNAFFRV